MINNKRLPKNIKSMLPAAKDYLCSRDDVLFAYLFGSFARGNPGPLSDVDIAVYLSEVDDVAEKEMEISGGLTDILATDEVDFVILNFAPLTLEMKILENKKVIVDKAPFMRHRYESLTMRKYFDFSKHEMNILEKRFLHG